MSDQNLVINREIEHVNKIKDQLEDLSWDEVKNNPEIIRDAISTDLEVNAADMLLQSKAFILSQLFSNFQSLSLSNSTKVLKRVAEFDLSQGPETLIKELDQITPDLEMNKNTDLQQLQPQAKRIVNGLNNVKKIALLKMAEDLHIDISIAKNLSPGKVDQFLSEIQSLSSTYNAKLLKGEDLTNNEVLNIGNILKKLGRSKFEIDSIIDSQNILSLIYIFQKTKDALQVTQQAYKDNLINQLVDPGVVAQILEKIKSK